MACVDPIAYWNEEGGRRWTAFAERRTKLFAPIRRALIGFAAPRAGEHVLDVGCGTGATVFELARRVSPGGRVVGVDVSRIIAAMAQDGLDREKLANAEILIADAATHRFPAGAFDLVFSQFGIMFFTDPVAAFQNLRRALKPNGRLAFGCWRQMEDNACFTVPFGAAKQVAPAMEPPPPDAPGPLYFKDRARIEDVLARAGFSHVTVQRHDELLRFGGPGEHAAAEHAAHSGPTARLLANVDPSVKEKAIEAIAKALEPYTSQDGICLGSSIWLVSAKP